MKLTFGQRAKSKEGGILTPGRFFAVVLLGALALRLVNLDARPLHADEANVAWQFLKVSRAGSYSYGNSAAHGPFQYYMGGATMFLLGQSEFAIRFPFALLGSLVPMALMGFRRYLGGAGSLTAAALVSFSPSFVYFSRDAIQEVPFVLATALFMGSGLGFASSGSASALIAFFLAGAWMVTLKETFVTVWSCLALSLVLGFAVGGKRFRRTFVDALARLRQRWRIALVGGLAGLLFVGAAYSDGFRDATGLRNLLANLLAMYRGSAVPPAALELHTHDMAFYLGILCRYEWPTLLLAAWGLFAGFRSRRPIWLVLTLYAVLVGAVHLAFPYKTPWLILTPLLPLILLAGYGGGAILNDDRSGLRASPVLRLLGAVLIGSLGLPRAVSLNYFHPADPAEPLVYHQSSQEQVHLAADIHSFVSRLPPPLRPKALICLPHLWPLAWYLRDLSDVAYVRSSVPPMPSSEVEGLPLVVTLEAADPKFLKAFSGSQTIPPFSLPGYWSRRYVLIPPEYNVARLWVHPELARTAPEITSP